MGNKQRRMGNVHKIPLGKEDFGVNLNPPYNV